MPRQTRANVLGGFAAYNQTGVSLPQELRVLWIDLQRDKNRPWFETPQNQARDCAAARPEFHYRVSAVEVAVIENRSS
jgi:hypothetical protein